MRNDFAGAVILFFLSLFAYVKLVGPIPFSVTSVTTNQSQPFTVTGEGKVTATPDVAIFTAGVTAQGATARDAQNSLNSVINKVSDAVKNAGVEGKDIQTSTYSITPSYNYQIHPGKITGYTANSNLTVKVRAMARVNSVIDAATSAGANELGGVTFDVSDKSNYENEARAKAVADAKAKAENAAKIAGFSLGTIVNYSETFGGMPRPVPMMAQAEGGGPATPPTQVEPGTNEISVTVTLSYEIR